MNRMNLHPSSFILHPFGVAVQLAVLGAGPIGLEAALYARSVNLPVTVYERGRVGEHLQRWGHVRLFTPFGLNTTPLGRAVVQKANPQHTFPADGDCITGKEHVSAYLMLLAKSPLLQEAIRTDTQVLAISRRGLLKHEGVDDGERSRQPFRLLLRETQGGKSRERIEQANVILDCTGTYGKHRWMGDGGIPAVGELAAEPHISYGLDDVLSERKPFYAGKTILLVGGGYSAATTVCNLATLAASHQDTWVIWLARCLSTQPIKRLASDPFRERDRLAMRANTLATRTDGNVEFHNQASIEAVESAGPDKGFHVGACIAGKMRTWDVDRVVANVGYTPDNRFYQGLHVHDCCAASGPLGNPESDFHILGAKSHSHDSNFLLREGFEQVREVFARIMGKPDLDLYKKR